MSNLKEKAQTKKFLVTLKCAMPNTFIMKAIAEALNKFESATKVKIEDAQELEQKLQEWILDLDDFLVQWLWNDKGKIPSQDLAILLEWREKFEELLKGETE